MNNNKIVPTTKSSAIFLAIVLVAGIIATISPSFIIKGVNAQDDPYYGYNSYGPTEYEMDNNYAPDYPSYGKDDNRDKSKDSSSKSIDIKKIKCNNINININNGQGGSGNGDNGNTTNGNGNTTDGFKKINKDGFTFICINNNNNVVAGGGGNQTIPPEPITCEECFSILSVTVSESLLMNIDAILTSLGVPHEELITIEDLCEFLETSTAIPPQEKRNILDVALSSEGVSQEDEDIILSCLEDLGIL